MRKFAISLITILLIGIGAFYGIKTWENQKNDLNQPQKSVQKVSHINLVALGDSLTEGVGDEKNMKGYSGRIAKKIRAQYNVSVTVSNFGKAGDRSDQIKKRLDTQQKFQKRLQKANVIVMTSGGNDLQQLLLKNVLATSPKTLSAAVKAGQQSYQQKLFALIKDIRSYNADAPIFIFGNYNPLYVHFADRSDFNDDVKLFNNINAQAAKEAGNAYFVSIFNLTYGQFKTTTQREGLIKESANSNSSSNSNAAMTAVLTGQKNVNNAWISMEDNYHPNNKGYNYMTTQLFNKMKKETKQWLIKQ
ncbi:SGNH/GDSL hydrolase family protein [Leuconostoc mesenteroides]|uniref:SGNH/GDSL hydrolase family protein n=1 Tax=Leuconostoc mesenteroides TaxID=1245 RepID=UPI00236258BB|nr:SGNH/GDSL hydrolase family protein [Leuconostoc mesenteroides]